MPGDKDKAPDRRYFAQVGSELIEIAADHIALHADGAALSTSRPIAHYRVRILDGNDTYEGIGASWKDAEAAADAQLPKAVK